MDRHRYYYGAHVTKVYDGDTVTADLDLGFGIVMHDINIRLWGIDAPEVRGDERPAGLQVRDVVRALVLDQDIVVRTFLDRTGKYGRPLGVLYVETDGRTVCVNQHLVDRGMATLNTYGDNFDGWPQT